MLVGLDWVLPMMQFKFFISYVYAYFMHTYPIFSFYLLLTVMCLIDCAMAPKSKSTPAWNPLGSESSSSSDPFPPLHIQFRDGKA